VYRFIYLLVLFSTSVCAEMTEFRAEYSAEYRGLPVKAKAVRELKRLSDNRFRLTSSAHSLFLNVTETSELEYRNQQLRPLSYSYKRRGLGRKKDEQLEFDWETGQLAHSNNYSPLAEGTLDKLSLQLKLSEDIARLAKSGEPIPELSYVIADKDRRKTYRFRVLPEERLETPLGSVRTLPVERVGDKKQRETRFWLALDHDYLLVRALQLKNDSGLELNLVNAVINGEAITSN